MNQPDTCGQCNYCTRKCGCPECNGYSCWGSGCGGCRNPTSIPGPAPLTRELELEPEIFIPDGGPEGVGVEPVPDCRWEACRDPTLISISSLTPVDASFTPAPLTRHLEPEIIIHDSGEEGRGVDP